MKLREQVIILLKKGCTHKEIAKKLNITTQGVYNIEKEYKREQLLKCCMEYL